MPSSKTDSNQPASQEDDNNAIDPVAQTADDETVGQELTVTIDRRDHQNERRSGDADAMDVGVMKNPRRKKQRRRHIDPTTCERDYSDQEIEFMRAMDDYKHRSGRMFPTCSEVLEVVRDLGYFQLNDEQVDTLGLVELEEEVASEPGDESDEFADEEAEV